MPAPSEHDSERGSEHGTIPPGAPFHIRNPGPHLDHMVRQTRAHLVQLSAMADVKANMLLTAASVVITLSVPHLGNAQYAPALRLLMSGCLLTVILAAWSTYPRLPKRVAASVEDARKATFNLLFFGDYSRMKYEEFEEAIAETMSDVDSAYEIQVREIYTLGKFLAVKKYRYVRWSYLSFLAGIVSAAVLALVGSLPDGM